MFANGRPLSRDELIIDPAVPLASRRALAQMQIAGQRPSQAFQPLIRPAGPARTAERVPATRQARPQGPATAASPRLIPFRETPPALPQQPAPVTRRKAQVWGTWALIFVAGTLLAAVAGSVGFLVILLMAAAIATIVTVRSIFDASSASQAWAAERWEASHAAVRWHQRYVLPRTDLDDESRVIWAQAVVAANRIYQSDVVRQNIVDSVQVSAALPQRLWEIAEGFASLSQARGRQREILHHAALGGQQVTAKVTDQERKMRTEARRLEGRVRRLEEIADLLHRADAAKQSELLLGQLGEVDDLIGDLRARSTDTPPELDPTERLRHEAQAIIDNASEAARDLSRPDLGEEPEDGE
jgi:hypothetical protein